jgi:hypothetical protein
VRAVKPNEQPAGQQRTCSASPLLRLSGHARRHVAQAWRALAGCEAVWASSLCRRGPARGAGARLRQPGHKHAALRILLDLQARPRAQAAHRRLVQQVVQALVVHLCARARAPGRPSPQSPPHIASVSTADTPPCSQACYTERDEACTRKLLGWRGMGGVRVLARLVMGHAHAQGLRSGLHILPRAHTGTSRLTCRVPGMLWPLRACSALVSHQACKCI